MDQGGPERHWSTTQHHGPAGAPGPLLVHLDSAWSTSCNHTLEIADQGGSRWTRGTMGTMELGVGPGALWSCFYILLMLLKPSDPAHVVNYFDKIVETTLVLWVETTETTQGLNTTNQKPPQMCIP